MFAIEVLLTEQELTQEFLAALEKRYLPEKFFYWFPLSVQAWLDLCQDQAPYKNYARSFQLVAEHAAEIAREAAGPVEVVSLGAGQGDKDLLVLEALRACPERSRGVAGRAVRYRPVDASQALLELAVSRAARAGITVRGLKADIETSATFDALAASAAEHRLYLVLGNSLGVMDPLSFLEKLRRLLRPLDQLLLDAELFNPAATMAGYDNPVNRRFAFGPLASLGLVEGRDGELVFSSETDARLEGLHQVSKHFRAARRLEISVAGRTVALETGETVLMNCSWKYSRAALARLLGEAGGLASLREFRSPDQGFVLVLARPVQP